MEATYPVDAFPNPNSCHTPAAGQLLAAIPLPSPVSPLSAPAPARAPPRAPAIRNQANRDGGMGKLGGVEVSAEEAEDGGLVEGVEVAEEGDSVFRGSAAFGGGRRRRGDHRGGRAQSVGGGRRGRLSWCSMSRCTSHSKKDIDTLSCSSRSREGGPDVVAVVMEEERPPMVTRKMEEGGCSEEGKGRDGGEGCRGTASWGTEEGRGAPKTEKAEEEATVVTRHRGRKKAVESSEPEKEKEGKVTCMAAVPGSRREAVQGEVGAKACFDFLPKGQNHLFARALGPHLPGYD